MSDVVYVNLVVANIDQVLESFDRLKVYRSVLGVRGPFTEVTDPTTRIALVPGVLVYPYEDRAGRSDYWYCCSYYNSETGSESSPCDPQQGQGDAALSVLSVADLKTNYLIGLDLSTPNATPFPDSLFEFFIKAAVSWIEKRLDMPIRPTPVMNEKHHYFPRDFHNWNFIQLYKYPLVSVQQLRMALPGQGSQPRIFDAATLSVDNDTGVLHVLPGTQSVGSPLFSHTPFWHTSQFAMMNYIPDVFQVDYTAGFPPGQVPMELVEIIGKTASFGPLNIAGDLLGGAGIASQSIGIDGFSQSINTTSSPMFSGYGARLNQYQKEVADQITVLRRTYKGVPMVVA